MSEHMNVTGECEFYHQPMEEDWGFAYCRKCKKIKKSLIVELHQGFVGSDYIQVICPKCKKVMWVAGLSVEDIGDVKGMEKLGYRLLVNDNTKCVVCKKPTNIYDCMNYSYDKKGKVKCICSEKCERKESKNG